MNSKHLKVFLCLICSVVSRSLPQDTRETDDFGENNRNDEGRQRTVCIKYEESPHTNNFNEENSSPSMIIIKLNETDPKIISYKMLTIDGVYEEILPRVSQTPKVLVSLKKSLEPETEINKATKQTSSVPQSDLPYESHEAHSIHEPSTTREKSSFQGRVVGKVGSYDEDYYNNTDRLAGSTDIYTTQNITESGVHDVATDVTTPLSSPDDLVASTENDTEEESGSRSTNQSETASTSPTIIDLFNSEHNRGMEISTGTDFTTTERIAELPSERPTSASFSDNIYGSATKSFVESPGTTYDEAFKEGNIAIEEEVSSQAPLDSVETSTTQQISSEQRELPNLDDWRFQGVDKTTSTTDVGSSTTDPSLVFSASSTGTTEAEGTHSKEQPDTAEVHTTQNTEDVHSPDILTTNAVFSLPSEIVLDKNGKVVRVLSSEDDDTTSPTLQSIVTTEMSNIGANFEQEVGEGVSSNDNDQDRVLNPWSVEPSGGQSASSTGTTAATAVEMTPKGSSHSGVVSGDGTGLGLYGPTANFEKTTQETTTVKVTSEFNIVTTHFPNAHSKDLQIHNYMKGIELASSSEPLSESPSTTGVSSSFTTPSPLSPSTNIAPLFRESALNNFTIVFPTRPSAHFAPYMYQPGYPYQRGDLYHLYDRRQGVMKIFQLPRAREI